MIEFYGISEFFTHLCFYILFVYFFYWIKQANFFFCGISQFLKYFHKKIQKKNSKKCFAKQTDNWDCSEINAKLRKINKQFGVKTQDNSKYWAGNCKTQQLTLKGYEMNVNNGKGLRQRYIDYYELLSPNYNHNTKNQVWGFFFVAFVFVFCTLCFLCACVFFFPQKNCEIPWKKANHSQHKTGYPKHMLKLKQTKQKKNKR